MQAIRFTLDGTVYSLTRDQVIQAVSGKDPQPIQKLAVRVGAQWYPVKQVFGLAMGMHNKRFNSTRAFDLLGRLDFDRRNADDDGPLSIQTGSVRDHTGAAGFDRTAALGLAVHLHAGRPDVDAETILKTATAFGTWLEGEAS